MKPSALQHKWMTLSILALSLGMIVLDGTIVGVSLPVMITHLKLNLVDAQWINAIYSVVFAALLLASGAYGDRIGRRKTLMLGLFIFALGSLTAALSTQASTMIASRALQGVGGALVLPATISSLNTLYRSQDRVTAFAIWGATMAGVAAIGPLLGGWMTTDLSWPWIFIINIPIGIMLMIAAFCYLPETKDPKAGQQRFDALGMLLSALGFGALVFGFIEGTRLGWWHPQHLIRIGSWTWDHTRPISLVPISLFIGMFMTATFLYWEHRRAQQGKSVLLNLNLFSIGRFSWGNLTIAMVAVGEFSVIFALPLYLVNVHELTTMQAGWVLAGLAFGALISGSLARHLAGMMGAAQVVIFGLLLEVVGIAWAGFILTNQTSVYLLTALLALYGFGMGLASAQLTSTILADVPVEHSGMGSAMQSTARQLGSALGSAIAGTVLATALNYQLPKALAQIPQLSPALARQFAEGTRASAGGMIRALAQMGTHSPAGTATAQVVHALEQGFSIASGHNLIVAALFLSVGLIAALRLRSDQL